MQEQELERFEPVPARCQVRLCGCGQCNWLAGWLAESQIQSPWTLARAANDAARTSWPCSMPPALITEPGSGPRPCQLLLQPGHLTTPLFTGSPCGRFASFGARLDTLSPPLSPSSSSLFMRLHLCCDFMLKVRRALQQRRRQLTQFKYAGSLHVPICIHIYTVYNTDTLAAQFWGHCKQLIASLCPQLLSLCDC